VTEEIPKPDPPLTPEQHAKVALLTEAEIRPIDEALLSNACHRWRKVARVVGTTMSELTNRVEGIPDLFYSQRVRKLVEDGRLESQGNLAYMRFSEVRLPMKKEENKEK
jgi:hypothetical protein